MQEATTSISRDSSPYASPQTVCPFPQSARRPLYAPLDATPLMLPLPKAQTVPYAAWRDIAYIAHHGCTVINPDAFLQNVPNSVTIERLTFPMTGGFLPVATRTHRSLTMSIGSDARKLYVLFCAFADDHEICTPLYRKTLFFPSDLDYGFANGPVVAFSTHTPDTVRRFCRP